MVNTCSGKSFENEIQQFFKDNNVNCIKHKDYSNQKNTLVSQYKVKDIFESIARVDFCYITEIGEKWFIECKNQKCAGSVDVKFPYYIENVKYNVYGKNFILILNGNGYRKNVLKWVSSKSKEYNFHLFNDKKQLEFLFEIKKIKPFLKWVGGKKKIMNDVLPLLKLNFDNYYEPFIGGGSVLFEMINNGLLKNKKVFVSDINKSLINCYTWIKNDVELLIQTLKRDEYNNTSKEQYLKLRRRYNEIKNLCEVENTALFIYLNKCCFNGLYRENSLGKFNVPYGTPKILNVDFDNLRNISRNIQNISFSCTSFENVSPASNSLVYCDPPYHKTFSSYNKEDFNEDSHVKLKEFCEKFDKFIVSNSDTDFIKDLYKEYNLLTVVTKKSIASQSSSRTSKSELLIHN